MISSWVGRSAFLMTMAIFAAIECGIAGAQTKTESGTEASEYPTFLAPLDPEVVKALESVGFADVTAVIIVQPEDNVTVQVPDLGTGRSFTIPEEVNVALPDPDNPQGVAQKEFNELVLFRAESPGWVTVCEKIAGEKVCWQEQR